MEDNSKDSTANLNRRAFLRRGGALTAGLGLGGTGLSLISCGRKADGATNSAPGDKEREVRVTATPDEVRVGRGHTYRPWFYDGP